MMRLLKKLARTLRPQPGGPTSTGLRKAFADGHFYSPIVDTAELRRDERRVWAAPLDDCAIDYNTDEQLRWLTEALPRHLPHYDYPDERDAAMTDHHFYTRNPAFSWLDSRMLFTVLRELRPHRLIEIGSGYSSLLAADVNRRFLDGKLEITCIEPYPKAFLRNGVPGISRLIEHRAQDVEPSTFDTLEAGDILFIDSSHVAKTGSDVNHIYFHVLPRLRPGVLIHIHDIFLPGDYPKNWVLEMGINWNEQYLVQALLSYSHGYEVMFGSAFVLERFPEQVRQDFQASTRSVAVLSERARLRLSPYVFSRGTRRANWPWTEGHEPLIAPAAQRKHRACRRVSGMTMLTRVLFISGCPITVLMVFHIDIESN